MATTNRRTDSSSPAWANLNPNKIRKNVISRGANGVGTRNGYGLGFGNHQITGDRQTHRHMIKGHIERKLTTEIRGKAVCLVVGQFCLDVK